MGGKQSSLRWASLGLMAAVMPGCLGQVQMVTEPSHLPTSRPLHFHYQEQVTLTSEPAGLRVYVDEVFAGHTPMTLALDFGWLAATQLGVQPAIRYTPVDRPPPAEPTIRRFGEKRDTPRLRDAFDDFLANLLVDMVVVLLAPPAASSHDEPAGSPTWTSTITLDQRPPAIKVQLQDGAAIEFQRMIHLRPDDPVLRAALEQAGALGVAADEPTRLTGQRTLHVTPEPVGIVRTDAETAEPLPLPSRSHWLDEMGPQWLHDYDPAIQRR